MCVYPLQASDGLPGPPVCIYTDITSLTQGGDAIQLLPFQSHWLSQIRCLYACSAYVWLI